MNLQSEELSELIHNLGRMYSFEAKEDDDFVIDGLPASHYHYGDESGEMYKGKIYDYAKLNNGFCFVTGLGVHAEYCFLTKILVVNGKFEGEKFHFNSAVRLHSKYEDYTRETTITAIEPQIDINSKTGIAQLRELLITSFETLGLHGEDVKKLLDGEKRASEVFEEFKIRIGRKPKCGSAEKKKSKSELYRENYPRSIQLFANANGPNGIRIAKENGAEAIGLVRIEHMKGTSVEDFTELFRAAGKMPISIRLLLEDENGNKKSNLSDYKPLLDDIYKAAYEILPDLTLIFPAEILTHDFVYQGLRRYKFKIGGIIENPSIQAYEKTAWAGINSLSFGTNDISAKLYSYTRDGKEIETQRESAILTNEVADVLKEHIAKFRDETEWMGEEKKIGVCGYHASVPGNVAIFKELDVDYLSCIPDQIPAIRDVLQSNGEHTNNRTSVFDKLSKGDGRYGGKPNDPKR